MASTLNAFLDRYRQALLDAQVDALAELVQPPCLVMGPKVHALTDTDEIRAALRGQIARHQHAGITDMVFDILGHRRIDARYLTVDVAWEMRSAEGSLMMDFAMMYTLTAPERGWRIVTVAPLERGLLTSNPTGAHDVPAELRRRRS